jgi:hypothetical protein
MAAPHWRCKYAWTQTATEISVTVPLYPRDSHHVFSYKRDVELTCRTSASAAQVYRGKRLCQESSSPPRMTLAVANTARPTQCDQRDTRIDGHLGGAIDCSLLIDCQLQRDAAGLPASLLITLDKLHSTEASPRKWQRLVMHEHVVSSLAFTAPRGMTSRQWITVGEHFPSYSTWVPPTYVAYSRSAQKSALPPPPRSPPATAPSSPGGLGRPHDKTQMSPMSLSSLPDDMLELILTDVMAAPVEGGLDRSRRLSQLGARLSSVCRGFHRVLRSPAGPGVPAAQVQPWKSCAVCLTDLQIAPGGNLVWSGDMPFEASPQFANVWGLEGRRPFDVCGNFNHSSSSWYLCPECSEHSAQCEGCDTTHCPTCWEGDSKICAGCNIAIGWCCSRPDCDDCSPGEWLCEECHDAQDIDCCEHCNIRQCGECRDGGLWCDGCGEFSCNRAECPGPGVEWCDDCDSSASCPDCREQCASCYRPLCQCQAFACDTCLSAVCADCIRSSLTTPSNQYCPSCI